MPRALRAILQKVRAISEALTLESRINAVSASTTEAARCAKIPEPQSASQREEAVSCLTLVLFHVWGHTEANEGLGNGFQTVCRWPQRFEWMDRSRISGMDRFDSSAHAKWGWFLVMVLVLVFVQ